MSCWENSFQQELVGMDIEEKNNRSKELAYYLPDNMCSDTISLPGVDTSWLEEWNLPDEAAEDDCWRYVRDYVDDYELAAISKLVDTYPVITEEEKRYVQIPLQKFDQYMLKAFTLYGDLLVTDIRIYELMKGQTLDVSTLTVNKSIIISLSPLMINDVMTDSRSVYFPSNTNPIIRTCENDNKAFFVILYYDKQLVVETHLTGSMLINTLQANNSKTPPSTSSPVTPYAKSTGRKRRLYV